MKILASILTIASAAAVGTFMAFKSTPLVDVNPPSIEKLIPGVHVSWEPVDGAIYYPVFYREQGCVMSQFAGRATNTFMDIRGLKPFETYSFAFSYVSTDNFESDFSPWADALIPLRFAVRFPNPGTSLLTSTDLVNWTTSDATSNNGAWIVRVDVPKQMEFFQPQ